MPYTVQCRNYSRKTVNPFYNYSTVLGAAIKCKPYSEITAEIRTHLKTVKITLNIFAVYAISVKAMYVMTFRQNNCKIPN